MKLNFDFDELVQQENIVLCQKSLDDDDLEVINKVLRDKNAAVKKLFFSYNNITLADGKFTDALSNNNNTLELWLWLHNNAIGREGAKCLAAALSNNNTLKGLDLDNNNIGDEGVKCLADALKVNTTLEVINLGRNNIDDEGAKHLASALMVNNTLQRIYLADNKIGDEGAKSIATALLLNQGICSMHLCSNKIGDQGAEKLAEALEYNNTINELRLGDNQISNSVKRICAIMHLLKDANRERKELASQQWREIIAMKDEEIADNVVKAMAKRDRIIALLFNIIAKKDEEIASLKDSLVNSKPTIETVDLTTNYAESNNKRPRTDDSHKKSLASILLDEKSQKLVQVKQEKNDVEANLENVRGEKEAVERKMELELECKICFELKDETCALVPCGHIICSGCVGSYKTCPTCSVKVESRLRLYK